MDTHCWGYNKCSNLIRWSAVEKINQKDYIIASIIIIIASRISNYGKDGSLFLKDAHIFAPENKIVSHFILAAEYMFFFLTVFWQSET